MNALLKAIIQPKDGTRERVREAIATSQAKMEHASNRLDTIIKDMLDRNDQLTGRRGPEKYDEEDYH